MKQELVETLLEMTPTTDATCGAPAHIRSAEQDDVLASIAREISPLRKLDGIAIGTLVDLNELGQLLVDFPANTSSRPILARSIVTLRTNDIGREVALQFEEGNALKPIVMGLIQHPERMQHTSSDIARSEPHLPIEADIDGERLVFTAKKEIVLRCGKASITLTRAGKVLIRGAYLLSRSSGLNRIKGGSVQIN